MMKIITVPIPTTLYTSLHLAVLQHQSRQGVEILKLCELRISSDKNKQPVKALTSGQEKRHKCEITQQYTQGNKVRYFTGTSPRPLMWTSVAALVSWRVFGHTSHQDATHRREPSTYTHTHTNKKRVSELWLSDHLLVGNLPVMCLSPTVGQLGYMYT